MKKNRKSLEQKLAEIDKKHKAKQVMFYVGICLFYIGIAFLSALTEG